jgi:hypothetical protein
LGHDVGHLSTVWPHSILDTTFANLEGGPQSITSE